MGNRAGIGLAALAPWLLAAASGQISSPVPPGDWPLMATDAPLASAPLASAWPLDVTPAASDPFLTAAQAPPMLLPLRHCGIADCLRPAPGAHDAPPPRDELAFARLFTTSPFEHPLDQRHAIAALIVAAITALLWRTRSRRARISF